ncbi:hypothetical protein SYNPS1DRAFT_27335, partial [Syncephalis pseudoplumigaleata]
MATCFSGCSRILSLPSLLLLLLLDVDGVAATVAGDDSADDCDAADSCMPAAAAAAAAVLVFFTMTTDGCHSPHTSRVPATELVPAAYYTQGGGLLQPRAFGGVQQEVGGHPYEMHRVGHVSTLGQPTLRFYDFLEQEDAAPQQSMRIMQRNPLASPGRRGNAKTESRTSQLSSTQAQPSASSDSAESSSEIGRKFMTMEEREAAYQAARARIFGQEDSAKSTTSDPPASNATPTREHHHHTSPSSASSASSASASGPKDDTTPAANTPAINSAAAVATPTVPSPVAATPTPVEAIKAAAIST